MQKLHQIRSASFGEIGTVQTDRHTDKRSLLLGCKYLKIWNFEEKHTKNKTENDFQCSRSNILLTSK